MSREGWAGPRVGGLTGQEGDKDLLGLQPARGSHPRGRELDGGVTERGEVGAEGRAESGTRKVSRGGPSSLGKERSEGNKAGGDVGSLAPSWPRALTVVIVGNHVAVPIVGGQKGLRRRLCGEGRQWAQSPGGLPPPPCPILPILSFFSSEASTPGPGGSAFSSGCSSQGLSGLLLLGGGLGCFWRRMYSTGREGGLSGGRGGSRAGRVPGGIINGPQGRGLDLDGEVGPVVARQLGPTHSPHSPPSLSGRCSPG